MFLMIFLCRNEKFKGTSRDLYRQDPSKGSLCNIFSRGFLGPSAQTSLKIKMNAAPKRKCQKTI